jgi:hypothetical protein
MDITQAHIGPSQPDDPNFPSGQVFYIDHNEVTLTGKGGTITDDPDFLPSACLRGFLWCDSHLKQLVARLNSRPSGPVDSRCTIGGCVVVQYA